MLVPEQHSLKQGISTEHAAFKLTDSVLSFLFKKKRGGGFLWFGKGFWLCYEILLAKLNFYSIQGITADWFRSYLTNRWQKVEIKSPNSSQNSFPDWGSLEHGVHQGSILGPLLFIIYMNDLPKGINCLSFSYVHSIIAYSIILWGNSLYSNNIFKVQKRAIRIIVNAGNRVSCRELFKKLNILPLHSVHIVTITVCG